MKVLFYTSSDCLLLLLLLCFALGGTFSAAKSPDSQPPGSNVRYTNALPDLGGKNLVPNGSFEAGSDGWSSLGKSGAYLGGWSPLGEGSEWGNLACLHGHVENSGGADGQAFLRIPLGGDQTPEMFFDYFKTVHVRELRPLAANLGWIDVEPGKPYTLSVSMRASRDGIRASLGARVEDAGNRYLGAYEHPLKQVKLTTQWQRYSFTFRPAYQFVFVTVGPDLEQEEAVAVDVDAVQFERGEQATAFVPRSELEIGICPSAPGGVFTVGEPATLEVRAHNAGAAAAKATLSFQVSDFFDQPASLPSLDLEVPAGAMIERTVQLPAQWRGFYRVQAICGPVDKNDSRLLRLAFVPRRTSDETVLGVNHAYPVRYLLDLARKAGVSWYRDWTLKWQFIEPEKGKFRWDISDPQVDRIVKAGAQLIMMFPFPSTDWNSTAPGLNEIFGGKLPKPSGDQAELLLRARWAWPPKAPKDLGDFIRAAVNRYKDRVKVWEFLNESGWTDYSRPKDAEYVALLTMAYKAMHQADPECRVIGEKYIKFGVLDSLDIYSLHCYPGRALPERWLRELDTLRSDMQSYGIVRPIWLTEFSYFGTDDLPRRPFKPVPALWSEARLLSEREAAELNVRYCTIHLGRGCERIFLHSGSTDAVNRPGTESCLFTGGSPRKAFAAMAVFTELLGPKPKCVGYRVEDKGCVFGFETGTQSLLVLWSQNIDRTISVPSDAECFDLVGAKNSDQQVVLTRTPVYFVCPAGKAAELVKTVF